MTIEKSLPITVSIGKDGTGSASKKMTLKTAGTYVDQNIEVTGDVTATLASDARGSLTNAQITGQSYITDSSQDTIIPNGGSLYINAGFFPNTRIDLSHMLPKDDDATNNAGVAHIRNGYEAINVEGNRIVGTMPDVDPAFSGGDIEIKSVASKHPKVSFSSNGSLTDDSMKDYGVTGDRPSGTETIDYFSIGAVTSTSDGKYTVMAKKSAITYEQSYAGYLNKASGVIAKDADAAYTSDHIDVTPQASTDFARLYIPKAAITQPTGQAKTYRADYSVNGMTEVRTWPTDDIFFTDIDDAMIHGQFNGYAIDFATTGGNITKGLTSGGDVSASKRVYMRKAQIYPIRPGSAEEGEGDWGPIIRDNTPSTVTITGAVSASSGVSTSGVLSTAPSTGKYLTINGTYTSSNGHLYIEPRFRTEGGYLEPLLDPWASPGYIITGLENVPTSVSVTNSSPKYIKVYDGSYEIA